MTDKKTKQDSLSGVTFRPPENDDIVDDKEDNKETPKLRLKSRRK